MIQLTAPFLPDRRLGENQSVWTKWQMEKYLFLPGAVPQTSKIQPVTLLADLYSLTIISVIINSKCAQSTVISKLY
jgi:hypothetical protein